MSTRMAVVYDPKKLLLPDPGRTSPFMHDQFFPMTGGLVGALAVYMDRRIRKRPAFSGIQSYFKWAGFWYAFGYYLLYRHNRHCTDNDAVYRHYVELHPEDFPPENPKKLGDIFKPWRPIR